MRLYLQTIYKFRNQTIDQYLLQIVHAISILNKNDKEFFK